MPDAQSLIGSVILTSSQNSIEFTNLPSTYRDLILIITLRNCTTGAYPGIRFNGDSGANYSRIGIRGNASTTTAYSVSSESAAFCDGPTADEVIRINVMDYTATDKFKTLLTRADSTTDNAGAVAGRWASTAAINRLTVTPTNSDTYGTGSTFTLYGVLA
jgi:hypothetical protein